MDNFCFVGDSLGRFPFKKRCIGEFLESSKRVYEHVGDPQVFVHHIKANERYENHEIEGCTNLEVRVAWEMCSKGFSQPFNRFVLLVYCCFHDELNLGVARVNKDCWS